MYAVPDGRKEKKMEKYCVKCGRKFDAAGREVICPACKQAAAEEAKRAAVLRTKRASWTGESVPVRISGRASTIIREYGASHGLSFAVALDALLQASDYFADTGKAWDDITPYKSHRRDKHATEDTPQDVQGKPQAARAAKTSVKTTAGKTASKASKPSKTAKK